MLAPARPGRNAPIGQPVNRSTDPGTFFDPDRSGRSGRRAKIIRLTARGEQALRAGSAIVRDIVREWAERIGEENMQLLRGKLELLVSEVGPHRE